MTTWSRRFLNVRLRMNDTGDIEYVDIAYRDTMTDEGNERSMGENFLRHIVYADLTEAQKARVDAFVGDAETFVAANFPLA